MPINYTNTTSTIPVIIQQDKAKKKWWEKLMGVFNAD